MKVRTLRLMPATAHCMRVIAVDDNKTVHPGSARQTHGTEVDDIVDILEEVEMILLHIEDNRNGRCKAQERVAVFAAFNHKTALAADTERTADGRRLLPTITVGSICASMVMSVIIEVEVVLPCVPARQTTLS